MKAERRNIPKYAQEGKLKTPAYSIYMIHLIDEFGVLHRFVAFADSVASFSESIETRPCLCIRQLNHVYSPNHPHINPGPTRDYPFKFKHRGVLMLKKVRKVARTVRLICDKIMIITIYPTY